LRYIYKNDHDAYERIESENMVDKFKKIVCYTTETLSIYYNINGVNGRSINKKILLNKDRLYVQTGSQDDVRGIAIELSNFFKCKTSIDDFMINILYIRSNEEIEQFLKAKNIEEIPKNTAQKNPEIKIKEPKERAIKQDITNNDETPDKELVNIPAQTPADVEGGDTQAEVSGVIALQNNGVNGPSETDETSDHHGDTQKYLLMPGIEASSIKAKMKQYVSPEKSKNGLDDEWTPEIDASSANVYIQQYEPTENQNPGDWEIIKTECTNDRISHIIHTSWNVSEKVKNKIGKWGEEYAFKCLKHNLHKKYPHTSIEEHADTILFVNDGKELVTLTWLNKYIESSESYDIKYLEDNTWNFVEVKTTITNDKEWLEISNLQWNCAIKNGENYHIYRVLNAGTNDAKVRVLTDPYKLSEKGIIKITPYKFKIIL
jgi:hypothetical protein